MNNLAVIFAEGGMSGLIYIVIFIMAIVTIVFGLFSVLVAYIINSINKEPKSAKYYWSVFAICSFSALLVSGVVCGGM